MSATKVQAKQVVRNIREELRGDEVLRDTTVKILKRASKFNFTIKGDSEHCPHKES